MYLLDIILIINTAQKSKFERLHFLVDLQIQKLNNYQLNQSVPVLPIELLLNRLRL